jgi:RecJ-like exonuclease
MKEKTLLKLSVVVSIIGLAVLFIALKNISIDTIMLNKIDGLVDEQVIIEGVVVDISITNSTTFVKIEKNELTSVILFGKTPLVETGDFVQIRGKVAEHNGKTEVIGEEMRVV